MINDEDILEHALNFGIASAGKRFHVNDKTVLHIVHEFVQSVTIPCDCMINNLNGNPTMCFSCTGSTFQSISLRERVQKLYPNQRLIKHYR